MATCVTMNTLLTELRFNRRQYQCVNIRGNIIIFQYKQCILHILAKVTLSWQKLGFCIHEQPFMLLHHRGLCQDEIYASMLKNTGTSVV